jgi:hypothetical protein
MMMMMIMVINSIIITVIGFCPLSLPAGALTFQELEVGPIVARHHHGVLHVVELQPDPLRRELHLDNE